MDTFSTTSSRLVFFVTVAHVTAMTSNSPAPLWNSQTAIGLGRNIRHLPCVSRRSGQTGVCMFAFSCAKANGTHLGTCIDRFYFGSCCKLELQSEEIAAPLDNNHIYEEAPSISTEQYYTYQLVQTTTNVTDLPTPQSSTMRTPTVVITSRPTKPVTLSEQSVTLGTLVQTHKPSHTPKPPHKPTLKPQTTSKPLTESKPVSSIIPSSKPSVKPTITPKPKPSNTTVKLPSKPVLLKPSINTTVKPSPSKRPSTTQPTKPHHPSSQKPFTKPTNKPIIKPQTRPPLKPGSSVTSRPSTDPDYIKLPLVTVSSSPKPSVEPITISNEIIKKPVVDVQTNLSSQSEGSNTLNESEGSSTTSPTLLVTWTTVDEIPVQPLPMPVPTPTSPTIKNETSPTYTPTISIATTTVTTSTIKTSTVTTAAPLSTTVAPLPTWVQVSISTPGTTGSSSIGEHSSTDEASTQSHNTTAETTVHMTLDTNVTETPPPSYQNNDANVNMSDYLDVCGRRLFPQSRIVGGDKATFGKWPWQISLRQWRTSTYLHKCGAALLNENWAITAAHCVENVAPSDLLLRLGEHDLSQEDEPYGFQERRVQIVASHPQFDPRTFEYDLALLRFYELVTFQPNIIPICIPQDDTNFVGSTAFVTGWGRLYEDGPLPSVLQEVSVPVINNSVCETMYRAAGYIEHIPDIFICAGWKKGGFDSCEGDSGGPMVIQRPDKRWLLAGVISWGIGCAEPNQPGVYTRISEFRGWINQILQF